MMQGASLAGFWVASALVAYAWIGYPVVLYLLARRRPLNARSSGRAFVSIIVAAFNEVTCMAAKLRSALDQRYPWDRLEVIVVSDGSTDGTDDVVRSYPDPRVRLVRQEPRRGKSLALNLGVAAARGDILVFTDANALFAPDAIARLVAPFEEPRVGLVSGQGLYVAGSGADARRVGNGYVRYEALLKSAEAALGFVAGADGAIYALRRRLYAELDPAEVNDLVHPIQAALAGQLSRFDPAACTFEPPSRHAQQEFRRHARIVAQGIQIARHWLPRLCGAGCWRAAWMLVSHRALRWATGPLLIVAFVSNVALVGRAPLYAATLALQAAFFLTALTGFFAERAGRSLGRLAIPYYFCVVSAAGIAGFVRFLRSGAESTWAPTGQAAPRERAA